MYFVFLSVYKNKASLEFFIKNAISMNADVKFYIIVNGAFLDNPDIQNRPNVHVERRENLGHDFGAWSSVLHKLIPHFKAQDKFIFLNDTVLGPFMPRYVQSTWYSCFTSRLSDQVKLSGLTKNYHSLGTHIQSMAFCTDYVGLEILLSEGIFHSEPHLYVADYNISRMYFIKKYEIGMTQLIETAGYKTEALYMAEHAKLSTPDVWYLNKYFGTTIHPLETMFVKVNRIYTPIIDLYYKWFS